MEPNPSSENENPWLTRLGFFFLFLFALLWSLGPFFFWTLLSLTGYFFFLHFYRSPQLAETVRRAFEGRTKPPGNPYQTFRPRGSSTGTPHQPQKIMRGIVIGFFVMFFVFFLIGIFSGEDDVPVNQEVTAEPTPEENNMTTYWNDKGNAALQNDLRDSALYYYDQALAIDPQNMYALYNKGLAYILATQYRQGNSLARRCLTYHPDYDPAWWLLGYSYDLTNETDSSLYCLEQAYRRDYSDPEFLKLLAEVYLKKNNRTEALAVYQKVIAQDTTNADVYRKMAELDPENASTYLRKASELSN